MYPGTVTRVVMKFALPAVPFVVPSSPRATSTNPITNPNPGMGLPAGLVYNEYVWHCHILEHEEHDMMRPLVVSGTSAIEATVVASTATLPVSAGFGFSTALGTISVTSPAPPSGVSFSVTGKVVTATVQAGTTAQTVTFTVADSGAGIGSPWTANLVIK